MNVRRASVLLALLSRGARGGEVEPSSVRAAQGGKGSMGGSSLPRAAQVDAGKALLRSVKTGHLDLDGHRKGSQDVRRGKASPKEAGHTLSRNITHMREMIEVHNRENEHKCSSESETQRPAEVGYNLLSSYVMFAILLVPLCFFAGYVVGTLQSSSTMLLALRWGGLAFTVIQNTASTLVLRMDRTLPDCLAVVSSTVLVCYAEVLKLSLCLLALGFTRVANPPTCSMLEQPSTSPGRFGIFFFAVPSYCWLIQTNLKFVAAAHLSAVNIILLERAKVIFTALLMTCMLGRRLNWLQWMALVAAVVGTIVANDHRELRAGSTNADAIGVITALVGNVFSSFASVYSEAILKGDRTSLAVRNAQLCMFSIPIQLFCVLVRGEVEQLFYPGRFCLSSWVVIFTFVCAGLITSVVTRYADNNLKSIAQLVATVFTVTLSVPLFGLEPGTYFVLSCVFVIISGLVFIFADSHKEDNASIKSITPQRNSASEENTAFLRMLMTLRRRSLKSHQSSVLRWVWPKELDGGILLKHLEPSVDAGIFTNHGPVSKRLEQEAKERLMITQHAVLAVASGTAGLHALMAVHLMRKQPISGGILVSAFGFPPILQGNWKSFVRVVDIDPVHGGPSLPLQGEPIPSIICLVNPFGYRVDVHYYRRYCDSHHIPLWMDNASTPLHLLQQDGTPLHNFADGVVVSLHETKPLGRGEGGLLLVHPQHESVARCAVNFGYDVQIPPDKRVYHEEASNWRMSDFQAAVILMHWELHWNDIREWMIVNHDKEVRDIGPFKAGAKGSLFSCLMEKRQSFPDPKVDIKYYYRPMRARAEVPNAWEAFEKIQCRPFHPGPGYYGDADLYEQV